MIETQGKILDTAERLFGEQGYAGTSLRQIIAKAGVNLAAIHYHFGSKEELLDQLVKRKVGPVNQERLAMLERFEAQAAPAPVPVDKLLRAFLEPPLLRIKEHPDFARMMGRLYGEGLMPRVAEQHFQTVIHRFTAAFTRSLPHLDERQVAIRLQFMVGAMAHTMLFAFQRSPIDSDLLIRDLIGFVIGGLKAPALPGEITEENS
ncbi:MAG TPA: TetR family transcriptional regulator [Bryobacteraceae bacterium]|nr:TetR family transcriptional regulator [Bryobacteraceae bacterium]